MGLASLAGRVALVTGGSSGLGLATSLRLLQKGKLAGIVNLDKQPPVRDIQSISKDIADKFEYVKGDVRNETDVQEALDLATKRWKRLDYAINVAGVAQAFQFYHQPTDRSFRLESMKPLMEINTIGTFNVIRLAVPLMITSEPLHDSESKGVIINTSCISSTEGEIGQSAYSASKGGLNSMALTVARDLAEHKIRCVTIAPGLFATPMIKSLPTEVEDMWGDLTPAPARLGEPDEFGHLVENVLINNMINGATIRIDGALRLQIP